MKTVLFGGTFDPPHLGHKMIIEELIKMEFDSILVFISPPFIEKRTGYMYLVRQYGNRNH